MVNDLTQSEPRVLYVADGRDGAALDGYVDAVGEAGCEHIEMVAMDMWPAYIRSVREHTDALIAFDTFHGHSSRRGGRKFPHRLVDKAMR